MSLSRSEQMARVRGRDTAPERLLSRGLWAAGLRYRLQSKTPVGRPDLVILKYRLAVFVDGCFWHGCPDHYVRPRTHTGFWSRKLLSNVERDIWQTRELEASCWRVIRIWEHQIWSDLAGCVEQVLDGLRAERPKQNRSWRVSAVQEFGKGGLEQRVLVELRGKAESRTLTSKRSTAKWSRRAQQRGK